MRWESPVLAAFIGFALSAAAARAQLILPAFKAAGPSVSCGSFESAAGKTTNILTGQDADNGVYDLQLAASAALVASDDTGLHKTLYAAPGTTEYKVASDITRLGDLEFAAPLVGLVYLTGGHRNEMFATNAAIAVFKASVVGTAAKFIVGRHRPTGPDGGDNADRFTPFSTTEKDTSFPSGHTLTAFSVASVWAYDKPRERYEAYGLAGLVGLSRIILGAHWPSDVLAGAALGMAQGRQVNTGGTRLLSIQF